MASTADRYEDIEKKSSHLLYWYSLNQQIFVVKAIVIWFYGLQIFSSRIWVGRSEKKKLVIQRGRKVEKINKN